ncbi:MAG: DUF3996 domain-containing protein [candidate division WOR-3 bacterium]|nr:DUF3996 domain-containing protein [candidate division WOR-3 bacterium]MCX7947418.1 DUF3996 domain-containing protein [candidate division WOR-3 bacterium]MDW8151184.1 DUF3996 domain-containing protein [candidate division WOR-3 bacterium]
MIYIILSQLHSIGAHIGLPTALNLRLEQDIRIMAGWNIQTENFYVSIDKDFNIPTRELQPLKFYIGVGGYLTAEKTKDETDVLVGIRIPFTLLFSFTEAPIDLGFQITPAFGLVPKTTLYVFGGLIVMFRL